MVGGHPGGSDTNEVLYRFQFPEKTGRAINFLMKVGLRWNIACSTTVITALILAEY